MKLFIWTNILFDRKKYNIIVLAVNIDEAKIIAIQKSPLFLKDSVEDYIKDIPPFRMDEQIACITTSNTANITIIN